MERYYHRFSSFSALNPYLHRSFMGQPWSLHRMTFGRHHTHSHEIDSCPTCMWMKRSGDQWFSLNKISAKKNSVQRHCTYFLIYNWPWPCYLGSEIGCCLVDHCWFLTTKQQWNLWLVKAGWHFAFVPLVHIPLFSWRYHQCSFI
jgi:hypothetical protein